MLSSNVFKLLISHILAFDDRQRRSEQRGDKLAPIPKFYEQWTQILQLLYVPNAKITLDEQLCSSRGRSPFAWEIWHKILDSSGFWHRVLFKIPNLLGQSGKQCCTEQRRVVLGIVFSYRGRNVSTGNKLALELLKQKITTVGTVKKNKRLLTVHATINQLRKFPIYSSKFFSRKINCCNVDMFQKYIAWFNCLALFTLAAIVFKIIKKIRN